VAGRRERQKPGSAAFVDTTGTLKPRKQAELPQLRMRRLTGQLNATSPIGALTMPDNPFLPMVISQVRFNESAEERMPANRSGKTLG